MHRPASGRPPPLDGVELPYRPAAVDAFSGITRHKHTWLTCQAVFTLNNLIGSTNAVGGFCGFDPICNGWTDDNPNMSWSLGIWEPEGLIDNNQLLLAFPNSYYTKVYESDYTPTTMGMMEIQPLSEDNHFEHVAQAHPDLYHTQAAEVAFCYACNPIKWWGQLRRASRDLNELYLCHRHRYVSERIVVLLRRYPAGVPLPGTYRTSPHAANNHRVIGGMDNPWTVPVWQKVVEPR